MFLVQGFLTGLSVGVYCIGICLPVVIPILLSQRRHLKSSFWVIIEFSAGRLLGYILFGAIISWLGATIATPLVHWLVTIGGGLMGVLMIVYCLGFWVWGTKVCGARFKKVKVPFVLGFLTGVNVCPPFLASVGYLFSLGNILAGVGYFLMFFLGTSVYIIPLGFLSVLTTNKVFRKVALVSGVLAGVYFLYFALRNILRLV